MAQNLDNGPVKNDDSDTGDQASPCFGQQVLGKSDGCDQDLLLSWKACDELLLQEGVKSKSFCHGKCQGQYRDDGQ